MDPDPPKSFGSLRIRIHNTVREGLMLISVADPKESKSFGRIQKKGLGSDSELETAFYKKLK
jgi:hypothetical protein